MCGRVNVRYRDQFEVPAEKWEVYRNYLILDGLYNAPPGTDIPMIHACDGKLEARDCHWGIEQNYGNKQYTLANMKAEKMWSGWPHRQLMDTSRCIILVNGFYEWRRDGSRKQPYYIHPEDRGYFAFAGVYRDGDGNRQCSIITTTPNRMMSDIHNRMPVILDEDTAPGWIHSDNRELLTAMMQPSDETPMAAYPVSSYVNNARNDGARCVQPLEQG